MRRDARGRGALSTTRSDMRRVWVVIGRRVGTHAGLGVGVHTPIAHARLAALAARGSRHSSSSRARRSIAYRRGVFRVRRRRRIRARTVEGSRVTCVRACARSRCGRSDGDDDDDAGADDGAGGLASSVDACVDVVDVGGGDAS